MIVWITALVISLLVGCDESDHVALVREHEQGYTRLARCAACHTDDYGAWKKSLHSRAMGVPADSTIVGDFSNVSHTYGGVTSRMFQDSGAYYMETLGPDGETRPYRVDYTVGVRQHQAYLTEFPDGRLQVLPLYWDGRTDRWVDAQEGGVIEGDRPVRPGEFYFWANPGRSWNYHCYDCHASRVLKGYDPQTDSYTSSVGSLTIDCEACHGPGAEHDASRETPGADLAMVDLEKLTVDEQIENCAQCHAAKEIVATGYVPGAGYYDHYTLHLPDRDVFYPDGQPRVYLYPVALHLMGPCYTEGDLVCTSCHDPHGSEHAVDLIADKNTDALCATCHPDIAADPTGHSHHKVESPGNRCIACHMPEHDVTGEIMTDHRIVSPVPENTKAFGVPNACNAEGCHATETVDWASRWATQWYGDYQTGARAWLEPFAKGRSGDPSSVDGLVERLRSERSPVWRATAASLLGELRNGRAVQALVAGAGDRHPMVRLKSILALAEIGDLRGLPLVVSALEDSARAVRINAAFAVTRFGFVPTGSPLRETHLAALTEHRRMADGVHPDDPGLQASHANVLEREGDLDAALERYERVAALDPTHPDSRADLERIQEKLRREAVVRPALEEAMTHAPRDLARRGLLGTFHQTQGNYGASGLQLRAATAEVRDPALHVAAGETALREGDPKAAVAAYVEALTLDPEYRPAYAALARQVVGTFGSGPELGESPGFGAWTLAREGLGFVRQGQFEMAAARFLACSDVERAELAAGRGAPSTLVGVNAASREILQNLAADRFRASSQAFSQKRHSDAEEAAALSLALWPDSGSALLLALARDAAGDRDGARSAAHLAGYLDPTRPEVYALTGSILELEDAVAAELDYRTALAMAPNAPGVRVALGMLFARQGKSDLAEAQARKILEHDPRDPGALELLRSLERQQD